MYKSSNVNSRTDGLASIKAMFKPLTRLYELEMIEITSIINFIKVKQINKVQPMKMVSINFIFLILGKYTYLAQEVDFKEEVEKSNFPYPTFRGSTL